MIKIGPEIVMIELLSNDFKRYYKYVQYTERFNKNTHIFRTQIKIKNDQVEFL